MEKLELYNSILGDIGNFVLVIFGFSVTLFTVLYSFILGRREQLKEYSDKIKIGDKNPLIHQRHSNAKKFIHRFKKFNTHLIFTIFVDLFIYFACISVKYFIDNMRIKEISTMILGLLAFLIIIYVALMLTLTVKDYSRITKI